MPNIDKNRDYEQFIKDRISRLRSLKNVSARDMSLSLGQSENYINMIENGHSLPSMSVFIYICDYFNVTPQEFFDVDTENPVLIKEINSKLFKLSDEQQLVIRDVIKNFKTK